MFFKKFKKDKREKKQLRRIVITDASEIRILAELVDAHNASPNSKVKKLDLWAYISGQYPETVDSSWRLDFANICAPVLEELEQE